MSAVHDKIASVMQEPACAINQAKDGKERRKGCSKALTPGAAAGGCAFDGAKISLQPIADVAHLVHGPIACEGNSWDNRNTPSSGPQLFRTGFTTDMSELDVIHGGEKKLFRAIREIIEKYDPPAIFVYQTCVPAMIGDDIEQVCKAARAKFNKPVVPINIPGFVGSKSLGAKLAGEALLDYVIGTAEPEFSTPYDIAIIAEYNVAGDFWAVKPLLDVLGIRVLANISGDARYHDIAVAHRARAAMMVCSKAMINVARKLEERYGIPYFEGSFYGISDTSEALRNIARLLVQRGAPEDLLTRTEALIAREEARARAKIEPFRAALTGKKVLLFTGGVKSWSVVSALQEAGMTVIGTSMRKSTKEDRARVVEIMGTDAHMFDELPPREMYRMLKESQADIMLSGPRSQFVALKAKTPWLDVNQERHHAYAGYAGMVTLVQEMHKSLANPVWEQVKRPAPWDHNEGTREKVQESKIENEEISTFPCTSNLVSRT
jgi:nitrogenase molybdenum-cofactor synthesis protein NifE